MSDDFDSRLHKELRALADAVPMSTTIRPVAAAGRYDSDEVSAHRPLSGKLRVRSRLPAGLSLAGIGLVAVLVVAAAMFGGARNGHSGSSMAPSGVPTPLPTTNPVELPAWPSTGLTTVQPKVVADFGVDELTSVVRGPGAAAYVLDSTAKTVYRVDLQTGAVTSVFSAGVQAPAAGGTLRVTGKPRLLATGGGDVLILDESSALWRWHPAVGDTSGRGVLSEVNIEDHVNWGTNVRAIGTFLIDPQIDSYNIYVVSPSERQVIKYPPAADGGDFPSLGRTGYLSVSTDLSSVDDLYVDGKIYLVDKGKVTRYVLGKPVLEWVPAQPPGSRTEKPFYTHLTADNAAQDQGTFYACDSANGRIVAFTKTAGAFVQQYMVPAGSHWFTSLTGMFVTAGTGGIDTLYWTESGNLMSAALKPAVVQTPSPAVVGPSVLTYMVLSNDSLALIASKFGLSEQELKLANPDLDLGHLTAGMAISIPVQGWTPTPGPLDPGLGG
jgi:LysM repeat protein